MTAKEQYEAEVAARVIRNKMNNIISNKDFLFEIPISVRSLYEFKIRYGVKTIADIYFLLTDKTKSIKEKKRGFYDSFDAIEENSKDLVWESYIENKLDKNELWSKETN